MDASGRCLHQSIGHWTGATPATGVLELHVEEMRILGRFPVATGYLGHPGHVGVVGRDQSCEGRLVAGPRERDRGGDDLTAHRLRVHVL